MARPARARAGSAIRAARGIWLMEVELEPVVPAGDACIRDSAGDAAVEAGERVAAASPWTFNLRLAFAVIATRTASESIVAAEMLTAFVYLLTDGSDVAVGYIAGIRGIVQLVCAAFAGLATDRFGSRRVLRVASLLLATSLSVFLLAFLTETIGLVFAGSLVYGAVLTLSGTAVEAEVAAQTRDGARNKIYGQKHAVMNLSRAVGPLVSLVMFLAIGDTWSVERLRAVLIAGVVLGIPAVVLMLLFRPADPPEAPVDKAEEIAADEAANEADDADDAVAGEDDMVVLGFHVTRARLPFIIAFSDVWGSLGAGMSVQFFVTYFMAVGLSPTTVAIILVLGLVGTAGASLTTATVSLRLGRAWTAIGIEMLGAALLVLMVLVAHPLLVAIVAVVRTSVANSVIPLQRSIVFDLVSQKHAGKWAAAESLTNFSWSASAVAGGYIANAWGYKACFVVTALFYVTAASPYFVLRRLIPHTALAKRDGFSPLVEEE